MNIFSLNHKVIREILNKALDSGKSGVVEVNVDNSRYRCGFSRVEDDEIRRYAKSSCKVCSGTGVVKLSRVSLKGSSSMKVDVESVCKCAIKNFAKSNFDCVLYEDVWFRFGDVEVIEVIKD